MQQQHLLAAFHALGHNLEMQGAGHRDDRGGDGFVIGVGFEIVHERAVDLELIDVEALEIGKRRVAGPEVVDRQAHVEVVERLEGGQGCRDVRHQHGLGNLKLEQVARKAGVGEHLLDHRDESGPLEMRSRDVHRHAHGIESVGDPTGRLRRRGHQCPFTERHDQSGLLGKRNEVARRHQPAAVVPAHERFDAGNAPGAHVDLRLIVQHQFAALERLVQGLFEFPALAVDGVEFRAIQGNRVAPAALDRIHRGIRVAQQRFDIGAVVRIAGDADRCADEILASAHHERLAHHRKYALGNLAHMLAVAAFGQEDRELVPAKAGHHVG